MEEIAPSPAKPQVKEINEPAILSIKDCLRLIGIQEVTANVFTLPAKKKTSVPA